MPFPHSMARMEGTPVSLAGAATSIIFVTSKDKHIFVATSLLLCLLRTCLSRQNTSFDKNKLVATEV